MQSKENSNLSKKIVRIGSYVVGLALEIPLVAVIFKNIISNTPMPSELDQYGLTLLALGGTMLGLKGVGMMRV